tara:strand:+ start:2718 stop:3374 length:657 start_codon:yes stop_codon:yes gene_type:complete
MGYIDKNHVREALQYMCTFHTDLQNLHKKHGLSLLENTGRRNILMSSAQEEFFAKSLSSSYKNVINDGKTGEPDIVIGELDKEIECKITTPTPAGGINLQTDYATLIKKGNLDYLYVIADRLFEKFVVLHYVGLTYEDFAKPSASSRGKSKLVKHIAEKKCRVLWGNVRSKNKIELQKLRKKLLSCSQKAVKGRQKILKSIDYWQTQPTNYKYEFEGA